MAMDLDPRRKRALFRARHMGMNENDIIFGRFAEEHLASMSDQQVARFEALIAQADNDLYDWVTGRRPVPEQWDTDVMRMLKDFELVKR